MYLLTSFVTPDTIKFRCHRRMATCPIGWKYKMTGQCGNQNIQYIIISDPTSTIRLTCEATGAGYDIKYVETELSKMFWSHNGRLIKSQAELDAALRKLNELLDSVSTLTGRELIESFTRVDLAWHFPLKFEDVAPYYRYAYILGIRAKPRVYKHGIEFLGTEIKFCIYDKLAQMRQKRLEPMNTDPVLRVEFRLSGNKLKEALGHDDKYPDHLDFNALNRVYRNYLFTSYPPIHKAPGNTIIDYLAFLIKRLPDYREVITDYGRISGLSKRRTRELHQEASSVLITMESFDWKKYLPEQGFPTPLEVYTLEEALQSQSTAEAAVTA